MNKKWYQYLFAIPKIMLIDIAFFVLAVLADSLVLSRGSGEGHPMPVITLIILFILAVITVIVVIRAVIKMFQALLSQRKKAGPEVQRDSTVQTEGSSEIRTERKFAWKYLLVIPIQIGISLVLLYLSFSYEINQFYADPTHIGFAIPIVSFLAAILFFILTLIVGIVMVVLAFRGK